MSNGLLERPVVKTRPIERAPQPKRAARSMDRVATPPRFSDFDAPVALPTREQEVRVANRRRRRTVLGNLVAGVALFGVTSFMAFGISTLSAQVMVEKARQEGISARSRTAQAERQIEGLQDRVAALASPSRVATWAPNAGFVSSEQLVDPRAVPEVDRAPKTLVAQRD